MYTPIVILIVTYGFSIADDIQISTGGSPDHYRSGDQTMSAIRFDHRTQAGDTTIDTHNQSAGTAHDGMDPEARIKRGSKANEVADQDSTDTSEKAISHIA